MLEAWKPAALAITHFGAHHDALDQLAALRAYLDDIESLAEALDEPAFATALAARLERSAAEAPPGTYLQATPPEQSYAGLARYLQRKREGLLGS